MGSFLSFKRTKLVIILILIFTIVFLARDILTNQLEQVFFVSEKDASEIVILYTNHEYESINNLAKIAWQKEKLEQEYEDVFLVSTGNSLSGDLILDRYCIDNQDMRGKPMVELMNLSNYDVLNLGRYEFRHGQQRLNENIDEAHFPVVTSNVEISSQAELEEIPSHLILETSSGEEILFLGLMGDCFQEDINFYENKFNGLSIIDSTAVVEGYSKLTKGIDLTIALSNLDYSNQAELSESTAELDLLISGGVEEIEEAPKLVNDSFLTQANARNDSLGKIKVEIIEGEAEIISSELIAFSEIREENSVVEEKVYSYYQQLEQIMSEVIINLSETITDKNVLGNLVTDAIRKEFNLDIALHNSGGIRNYDLGREVQMRDIYQLLPFSEELLIFSLSGEQLENLLTAFYQKNQTIDFSISGVEYDIILDEAEDLEEIRLKDETGELIKEDEVYKLGVNNNLVFRYDLEDHLEQQSVSISQRAISDIVIDFLESNELDLKQVNQTRIEINDEAVEGRED